MWPGSGPYYGVPVTNYLGWLFSGALAATLLLALERRWGSAPPPPGLLDSALIALAFWMGVAVFSGLLLPAVLGAALYLLFLGRRTRLARTLAGESRYKGGGDGDERRSKA